MKLSSYIFNENKSKVDNCKFSSWYGQFKSVSIKRYFRYILNTKIN